MWYKKKYIYNKKKKKKCQLCFSNFINMYKLSYILNSKKTRILKKNFMAIYKEKKESTIYDVDKNVINLWNIARTSF